MDPKLTLFGKQPSERKDNQVIWRGRGWRVDIYPAHAQWRWHLCISHVGAVVVDMIAPDQHPTPYAALRSVTSVMRGIYRALASAGVK